SGSVDSVGAPVWPSGATLAAEAVFIVTAEAASAAAPVSILRRSKPPPLGRWGSGKVSDVVMISSHGFLLGGKHQPAFRHKAGGRAEQPNIVVPVTQPGRPFS